MGKNTGTVCSKCQRAYESFTANLNISTCVLVGKCLSQLDFTCKSPTTFVHVYCISSESCQLGEIVFQGPIWCSNNLMAMFIVINSHSASINSIAPHVYTYACACTMYIIMHMCIPTCVSCLTLYHAARFRGQHFAWNLWLHFEGGKILRYDGISRKYSSWEIAL